jgi:hypothetical protein
MSEQQSALEFFIGGVPPFPIFRMHLERIYEFLEMPVVGDGDTAQGLAYIGITAYTEAFFKDQFAAVLNMFPEKVRSLRQGGKDVSVDLIDLLGLDDPLHSKFGFLLSERFDFGSPKAVNALYKDLLLITPFSKDKAAEFDKILAVRNLLVHHGGILTARYSRESAFASDEWTYFGSVPMTKQSVGTAALLALEVVKSTAIATSSRLQQDLSDLPMIDERRKAVTFMEYEAGEDLDLLQSLETLVNGSGEVDPGISDDEILF